MQELGLTASNSLHFLTMNISIAFSPKCSKAAHKRLFMSSSMVETFEKCFIPIIPAKAGTYN